MSIQQKIQEAQTKKYSLNSQLQRLKDSRSILEMKNSAVSSHSSGGSTPAAEGGFKLYHLIIVAILGLIVGSFAQTNYLSAPVPIQEQK